MADGTLIFDTKVNTEKMGTALKGIGKTAGTAMKGVGTAMKAVGVAVGAATTAVGAFAGSAISAGKDFDASMSQVAATMGKTVDEIQDLRDFAQEMGSTTAFSATEAADALNYMALAGYDSETSMKMLPNVLSLAAAGGIDLARASDMVTDAQTALGLSLDDTTELVDKMAYASSKSNTSVEQLGDAILAIGGNAKSLSGGTTELATTLGIMADNGIKGAEAGTHLRNIMLAMNPTTDAAAAAWKNLGVSAYDAATGQLRPMEDIFQDLSKAMDGMTDQQRTDAISSMFNKTDLAAVNALLDTQAGRWKELSGAIDDSKGSADAMAKTQLDNLAGDITLFQSALEGAKIAISDGLTPTLREFVQFGSDGLSRLTAAFKEGGLTGAMDELGVLLSEGLNMVSEMLPQVTAAGVQLLNALIQGIIDNLPTIITAAGDILQQLVDCIIENLPMLVEAGLQIIIQLATALGESLPELIPAIVDMMLSIVDSILDNIDLLIDGAIAIILGLADGLIAAQDKLLVKIPEIVGKIVVALIRNAPKLVSAAIELLLALGKGMIQYIQRLLEYIPRVVSQVLNGFNKTDWSSIGHNIIEGVKNGIMKRISGLVDTVKGAASSVLNAWKGIFDINSPSKKFAYFGEMCIAGFDQEFEDYNPYETLQDSFKANAGTLQASFSAGAPGFNFSTDGIGAQVAQAIQGMGVFIDGRVAGSLIAASVNNSLGQINARRT